MPDLSDYGFVIRLAAMAAIVFVIAAAWRLVTNKQRRRAFILGYLERVGAKGVSSYSIVHDSDGAVSPGNVVSALRALEAEGLVECFNEEVGVGARAGRPLLKWRLPQKGRRTPKARA